MKTYFWTCIWVLLGMSGVLAQRQEPAYVQGELMLQSRPGYAIEQVAKDLNTAFPGLKARLVGEISRPLHVWLLRFDPQADHHRILEAAKDHASVTTAQFNHLIQKRATLPNDANFTQQWQYLNTGAGGGVADADIDAELAWDFTTGGVTPLGDTIVACIIDDGLDVNHPDWGDNIWRNWQEIPNNGIDDDGNGYVDDYLGWDADNNNDNITGGGHGSPVAGIVGAQGNNGVGVAGVNWDVKLMIVRGGGDEAQAVAAYSYPLAMRKLWNQTGGAKGAYVVVTNASWGIDFGQPSQAPLWCAIYDSLGKYGVLNCGATANINLDIDVQGDLPTACPSDYLISVTNMNRQDNKVTSAGYGLTTIDLGAHGQDAYTVSAGGGYGGFGGTSGATPHVTGAVALLYSAPCPNLAALSLSHPDSAARLMKQFILDGTDPLSSLQGLCVTGGRLNLHKAILEMLSWDCTVSGCYEAFGLEVDGVVDTAATLEWSALSSADSFQIEIRPVGASVWASSIDTALSFRIDTLQACTAYEFRVASLCDTFPPSFSSVFTFTTDGCCDVPDGFTTDTVGATTASVTFDGVLAAVNYNVRIRPVGGSAWTTINGLSNPATTFMGLDSCTAYEYQVQTVCDTGATPFSASQVFQTIGCEGCDQNYCTISGQNSSEEWIASVQLGTLSNSSGDDNGYGDYTGTPSVQLHGSNTYAISLEPGFSAIPYDEYFRAFIDYNQDGDFNDAGELVFDAGQAGSGTANGNVTIPTSAAPGITRLRVVMRFSTASQACGTPFDFGEVEDYCVEISQDPVGVEDKQVVLFHAYPNPFQGNLSVDFEVEGGASYELFLRTVDGRTVREVEFHDRPSGLQHTTLSTDGLPAGFYYLQLHSAEGVKTLKVNLMK